MRIVLLVAVLGLVVTSVAGCGAPCNSSSVCAVSGGTGADELVCDGSDNRACNDDDRGLTIACPSRAEVAVCTPNGWAFQPAGTGGGG